MTLRALDLLPIKPGLKQARLSYVRVHAKAKSKASMATAKKLMKLMQTGGKSVSGVTIGPDGSVSVTAADAPSAKSASANPWDTELS